MSHTPSFYKAPRYLFRKHNILRILRTIEVKDFLDIGCGAGELACSLAENGLRGVALDFSEEAIKIASNLRDSRGIKKTNLEFKLGGFEQVKGKSFDLVSCFEVLEHIENDREVLDQLVSHSKKYVMISVPAKQKLFDSSDTAVGHFRRYEKDDLLAMLDKSNLEVLEFINYGYPFTDIVRVARKVLFAAKNRKLKSSSMKDKSKDSGINPIKLPNFASKIDLEKPIVPFYQLSRAFNKYNLSEGYLVLCQKKK